MSNKDYLEHWLLKPADNWSFIEQLLIDENTDSLTSFGEDFVELLKKHQIKETYINIISDTEKIKKLDTCIYATSGKINE